jgi:hypothetical protein
MRNNYAHPIREIDTRANTCRAWQWKRAVATLEHCEAREFVNHVLEKRAGSHRVLTADALLVAFLLTPMLGVDMHLSMVTATIRGWTSSERRQVGMDPHPEISYKMVCDAFGKLCRACDSGKYPDWDAGLVAQAFLNASLFGHPPTGAIAVDGTDLPSWAKVLFVNLLVDADADAPPPPEGDLTPADPEHPHAPQPGKRRPQAPVGPDGKYVYSHDLDARMGWRSASFGESEYYNGYEGHVVTDVPASPGPHNSEVPHIARALNLMPAGSHRGTAGLVAIERAGEMPAPHEVLCDRAYNYTRPATFSLPLLWQGYILIVDLHPNQCGVHPGPVPGTVWIDGTLFSSCIPPGLLEDLPITRDMKPADREKAEERRRLRQAWAFVPHGPRRRDGMRRYRGPAVAPARVRSPRAPRSMRLGYEAPTAYCDRVSAGEACGCTRTVTLSYEDFPNIRMPFQHGSAQWAASYHRRVGIESLFADLKTNRLHMRRGYFRIFGLTRHRLMLGFALAAMNLMILRDWHLKRDSLDAWGKFLGEPEPPRSPRPRRHHPPIGHTPDGS